MNKLKLAFVLFLLTPFIGVQFVMAATCPMMNMQAPKIESVQASSSMQMMDCHTQKTDVKGQNQQDSKVCQHCAMCHLVYLELPAIEQHASVKFVYENDMAQHALSQIQIMDSPPPKFILS
ncbi:MAG: hypothetical protein CMF61_05015 [Magnetococcales bacterium]|nr:hypothetical protein [Magnetococcales bacterium]|tara:strand:+ start:121 stop:483 length:363 start_codon:yes stop_codon:yes gene_type:complete